MRAERPGGVSPWSRFVTAVLAATLVMLAGPTAAGDADKPCALHVAWDPYEPYSYAGSGATPSGYDIEVVNKVAGMVGCSLSYTEMAWSDILVALESGRVDITVGTGFKPARARWSWYSESYRKEVVGLLLRKGDGNRFPGDSLSELFRHGFVFGKTTDDSYDADVDAVFRQYADQVRSRVDEKSNLERLLDRSIDGFMIEVNVAASLVERQGASERVEFHSLAFDAGHYRLQMSKKTVTPQRLAAINAALQQLEASGWLATRIAGYGIHGRGTGK